LLVRLNCLHLRDCRGLPFYPLEHHISPKLGGFPTNLLPLLGLLFFRHALIPTSFPTERPFSSPFPFFFVRGSPSRDYGTPFFRLSVFSWSMQVDTRRPLPEGVPPTSLSPGRGEPITQKESRQAPFSADRKRPDGLLTMSVLSDFSFSASAIMRDTSFSREILSGVLPPFRPPC